MKLKIISWDEVSRRHVCESVDETLFPDHYSEKFSVSIFADGGLEYYTGIEKDLEGKIIECDYIFPQHFLASGVRYATKATKGTT